MKEIISVIKATLETEIFKLFSAYVSGIHNKKEPDNKPAGKLADSDDDDIDIDFIGG